MRVKEKKKNEKEKVKRRKARKQGGDMRRDKGKGGKGQFLLGYVSGIFSRGRSPMR